MAVRLRRPPRPTATAWWLGGIIALAAANFFWQLGSSSYYVDEALSLDHAVLPLHLMPHAINQIEINPWTYFFFLHEWIGHVGSQDEFVTRLPSAVAAALLVPAVFWMARAFVGTATSLAAAALCAASPLVLQYGQEARAYIFAMLAITVAVAATVGAVQRAHRQALWLAGGAAAAILSLWLHYASAFVIAPLCVWLITRAGIPRWRRIAFAGVCLVAELLVMPIFLEQIRLYPNGGLSGIAVFNANNVVAVLGTPFDGRFSAGINTFRVIAVVLVSASLARLLLRPPAIRDAHLLAALAAVPLLAILVLGAVGRDVVATRYTAVAAPLLVTALAAAATGLRPSVAATVAAGAAATAVWGVVETHQRSGFFAPARETIAFIRAHQRPRDVVAVVGRAGDQYSYDYYGRRQLQPSVQYIVPDQTEQVLAAIRSHRRIWIISQTRAGTYPRRALLKYVGGAMSRFGYRPLDAREWTTSMSTVLYLTAPGKL